MAESHSMKNRAALYLAACALLAAPCVHVFEITAGDGTTNVAYSEDGKDLYITVVKDPNDPQARGSVVRVPNVE